MLFNIINFFMYFKSGHFHFIAFTFIRLWCDIVVSIVSFDTRFYCSSFNFSSTLNIQSSSPHFSRLCFANLLFYICVCVCVCGFLFLLPIWTPASLHFYLWQISTLPQDGQLIMHDTVSATKIQQLTAAHFCGFPAADKSP